MKKNFVQWFKNGDHPGDDVFRPFEDTGEKPTMSREGKVVRYFRRPDIEGASKCPDCERMMHDHGWIDVPPDGIAVCPGSFVVTNPDGTYTVTKVGITMKDIMRGSPLTRARRELKLAGMFNKESDYSGELGKAVLRIFRAWCAEHFSGGGAPSALFLLSRLAKQQNITPLTSDPGEWDDVSEMSGYPHWQSNRNPACFSKDGGKTYANQDDAVAGVDKNGVSRAKGKQKLPIHKSLAPNEAIPKNKCTCDDCINKAVERSHKELRGAGIGGVRKKRKK